MRGFTVTGAVSTQSDVASALASLVSPAVPLNASQVDPAAFNLTVGGEAAVKTADIKATINLNNGSITLGDIDAQRDDSGAYLTDTTVNLNGSGFLGASDAAGRRGRPVQPNGGSRAGRQHRQQDGCWHLRRHRRRICPG